MISVAQYNCCLIINYLPVRKFQSILCPIACCIAFSWGNTQHMLYCFHWFWRFSMGKKEKPQSTNSFEVPTALPVFRQMKWMERNVQMQAGKTDAMTQVHPCWDRHIQPIPVWGIFCSTSSQDPSSCMVISAGASMLRELAKALTTSSPPF